MCATENTTSMKVLVRVGEVIVGMNVRLKDNFVYDSSNITASRNLLARPISAAAHQQEMFVAFLDL